MQAAAVAHGDNFFRAAHFTLGYPELACVIPPGAELKPDIPNYGGTMRARGKCPGLLTSKGWVPYNMYTRPFVPERDCDLWHAWGGSVGLRLTGDLIALDVDSRDKNLSNRVASLAMQTLGRAPARIGQAPKALFLYRVRPEDLERIRYLALGFDDGSGLHAAIEVLCGGRQCLIDGPHGTAGEPSGFDYRWFGGAMCAYADLPVVSWKAIEDFLEACAAFLPKASRVGRGGLAVVRTEVDQDSLRGPEDHVRALVRRVPNHGRYESLIEMAAAVRGACQDDEDAGLAIFLDWCETWEQGEADLDLCTRHYWSLEPPFGLGVQRLEYLAAHGVADRPGSGKVEADPTRYLGAVDEAEVDAAVASFPPMPETGPSLADDDYPNIDTPQRPPLRLTSFKDAVRDARTAGKAPLIKGLLDRGAASILYGDSNVGKTFVAMLMGYHVSTGREFAGMRVAKGRVVYAAAEGGDGIRRRAAALAKTLGEEPDLFEFVIAPINLLDPKADLHALIALCKGGKDREDPAIVFLDTLSRIMAGGDENASTDMGALVTNIDRLRVETGAHICVIHHTGKDAAKGARGHSLLRAAVDTEMEVTEGEITVTKQRDLPKEWRGKFELLNVDLWTDEDGDQVKSAVAVLAAPEEVAAAVQDVTGHERDVLHTLVDLSGKMKRRPVGAQDIVSLMDGRIKQNHVRAVLLRLMQKGLAMRENQGAWHPTNAGRATAASTKRLDVGSFLRPLDADGNEVPGLFD